MLNNLRIIDRDDLLEEVRNLKGHGFRFAALTCESVQEGFELTYHLDLKYELNNLRINLKKGEIIESISPIYPGAFLIENEIQDFFKIEFNNLTIDYRGRLFIAENGPAYPLG